MELLASSLLLANERITTPNKLLSSLLGVVLEKRWKMFEGRAVQAVLISLLSTDEARGAKSICASVLDSL